MNKRKALIIAGILIILGSKIFAAAPKVIKAEPDNGDIDVDPKTRILRIIFDQDMDTIGGYSVVGGGPEFPKLIGKPKWRDKRTFEWRVRLIPNHNYWISINSNKFTNFRGANGQSAVPYPISFKTGLFRDGDTEQESAEDESGEPRIIKTVPEDGDMNVDPGLKTIEIYFNRDMDTVGGYSVCGGGMDFPKTIGKPKWKNKRTFVMRVKLVPDHEYNMSINCQSFNAFKSESGQSVIPYLLSFKTGLGEISGYKSKDIVKDNTEAAEILKESVDNYYSYRDIRGVDWEKLYEEYIPKLKSARSTIAFAKLTAELLVNAKDKHVWVKTEEKDYPCYFGQVIPNANFQKLPIFVENFEKKNSLICIGRFSNDIGYIYIDGWPADDKEMIESVYEAIWEFTDASGIIIDVRGNGGGAETLAREVAGCFVDERKLYAKHVNRAAGTESGFSDVYERYLEPNKRRPKYRGKIAVLSGPVVMSSCEAFILMMKQVPNCKIIGQTTQGSSGNPKLVDLGNGVTVYLPSWKAMRPDGTCFEGEGIAPDIKVDTKPKDFENNDPVIEAALKYIRGG